MTQGLFITFEGIDGCGKTTQLQSALRYLETRRVDCIAVREPGATAIGEKIRGILLSVNNNEMHNACEVLLYFAARAQLVREIIAPALSRGCAVLCDRFAEATFAYQGFGRGEPMAILESINAYAAAMVRPTLTFILDISVEMSADRLKNSGKPMDRLEGSGKEFYEKVRRGYLSLAEKYPKRMAVVPGEAPIEAIAETIQNRIAKLIDRRT